MYKLLLIATIVVCGSVLLRADDEATTVAPSANKGTIHRAIDKINGFAEKIPGVVKSINDGIEVRIENIQAQQDQHEGFIKKTIDRVASVAKAASDRVKRIGESAIEMAKKTAKNITDRVKSSADRLRGNKPTTPASVDEAVVAPVNAAPIPNELTKIAEEAEKAP